MNILRFFKIFLITIGSLTIIFSFLILFYGDTSSDRRKVILSNLDQMLGIGKQYDHYVANTPKKIAKVLYFGLTKNFKKKDIPKVEILINFKNLKILEAQRTKKLNNDLPAYAKAKIKITEDEKIELVNVKIRAKGDRNMHRIDIDQMSYKIDVRKDNYIFGMEEMSIQKPIVRNYGWELLFHEIMKKEGLINLKLIPVELLRNSKKLGIFVIEEGFSKELLETQGRKDGPIIGIEEELNHTFPILTYDYYSEKKWVTKEPDIYLASKKNLEYFKKNYNSKNYKISEFFDTELWAKYFAIIDVLKAYHAASTKSSKLYFNPSTGLFEPVPFDAHVGFGYDDFIFLDFYKNNEIECGYICNDKDWLKVFFNKKNDKFINYYIKYLDKFTSRKYTSLIKEIINQKIEPFNKIIYSEFSNSDRIFYKGFLPYFFDPKPIFERASLIKYKIKSFKNEMLIENNNEYFDLFQKTFVERDFNLLSDLGDLNKSDKIIFTKGLWKLDNLKIIDKQIILDEGAILLLSGDNYLGGLNNRIRITGKGMIVQMNGSLELKNIYFKGLKNIKVNGRNWSGSINTVNSKVKLENIEITSFEGEDAINLVNSITHVTDLKINNSMSDALDVDFGKLFFNKIYCYKSLNDCLDTSGAFVEGDYLYGENIDDKLASFGEKSFVKVKRIVGKNINIGVASKDGSNVKVNKLELENTKIYGASYIKKSFFNEAILDIELFENSENSKKVKNFFFTSNKNIIMLDNKKINGSNRIKLTDIIN
jgi:hypothetical protein